MSCGAQLSAFLANRIETNFDWEKYHCGVFVCDWVRIRTGIEIDVPKNFKGMSEAIDYLNCKGGYAHIVDAIVKANQFEYVKEAITGDIVFCKNESFGFMAGIAFDNKNAAFLKHDEGIVILTIKPQSTFVRLTCLQHCQ